MERKSDWKELEYFFCNVEGLGLKGLKRLFERVPDRGKAYELEEDILKAVLGEKTAGKLIGKRSGSDPYKEWTKLQQSGIRFLSYWDGEYPEQLRRIADPPKAVYVLGRVPAQGEHRVAIIGSRSCSGYGCRMARLLGEKLAAEHIAVVSGMARGIDGHSQWYALEAGGVSYGVLGCGVDVCYPKENRPLYNLLLEKGGVISEYPPGTAARANLFPPRNRIISALSEAVVVVEARERSGTAITVDMALEQGKEVLAVPGRVGDALSEGCNRLLIQGAAPVISVEEILGALGICRQQPGQSMPEESSARDRQEQRTFTPEEREIYELLDEYPKSVDELAGELLGKERKVSYGELCRALMSLCRQGAARQESAMCFVRLSERGGN